MSIKDISNSTKSKKAAAVNVTDDRDKILEEANEPFIEQYNQIKEALIAEETNIFETRYKIGQMVYDMSCEQIKYGSKSVERLTVLFDKGRDTIYLALLFVERYTQKEMEELTKLRNKNGDPLMWSHVAHLIRIVDNTVRRAMQQSCLDMNWTPSELLVAIQDKKGGKTRPNAGKPLARPKSLRGFIDQQTSFIDQLIKRKEKVWAGTEKQGDVNFFDVLDSTPSEKFDTATLTDLEKLTERYERASVELSEMATEISKVHSRITLAQEIEMEKQSTKKSALGKRTRDKSYLDDFVPRTKEDDQDDEEVPDFSEEEDEEDIEDDDQDDDGDEGRRVASLTPGRSPAKKSGPERSVSRKA